MRHFSTSDSVSKLIVDNSILNLNLEFEIWDLEFEIWDFHFEISFQLIFFLNLESTATSNNHLNKKTQWGSKDK